MSATTINLTRQGNGSHSFESFDHVYRLDYTPDPATRGAYGYVLRRVGSDVAIANFDNLNVARRWVSLIGFAAVDQIADEAIAAVAADIDAIEALLLSDPE
jgi:hypothetical protein